jgi:hypothetical protein
VIPGALWVLVHSNFAPFWIKTLPGTFFQEMKVAVPFSLCHNWAEQLAKAFDVHPAIIMLPEYESKEIQKAAA